MAAWAVKQSRYGRSLLFEFDGRKARGGTKGRSRTTLVHCVGAMHVLASVRAASPRKPASRTRRTHNRHLTPASGSSVWFLLWSLCLTCSTSLCYRLASPPQSRIDVLQERNSLIRRELPFGHRDIFPSNRQHPNKYQSGCNVSTCFMHNYA
jgi:hypothetical protein